MSPPARLASILLQIPAWLLATLFCIWAFGALYFDFPFAPGPAAVAFLILVVLILVRTRGAWPRLARIGLLCAAVAAWWATLQPSHDRDWAEDVARLPRVEFQGEMVAVHNVRDVVFQPDGTMLPAWTMRRFSLQDLAGIELGLNFWGSELIAHPIVIFLIDGQPPLAMSIEIRPERGEAYSAIGGFFRQYELVVVVGEERDVLGVRLAQRGETIFLFPSTATREQARERFMDYAAFINSLAERPRWYNAITTNCTTAIRTLTPPDRRLPWDWRLLINGRIDSLLYEQGLLDAGGRSFSEFREAALLREIPGQSKSTREFSAALRGNSGPMASPSNADE